ncbi:dnaJ homolog subfamily A member 4-like, partial [Rhincodon typus]|uniref:dnaJ homolog subfamily A member 4-like n=1 Tax=Rhincodon typus TaxID=259920 RepID=UPI0020306D34
GLTCPKLVQEALNPTVEEIMFETVPPSATPECQVLKFKCLDPLITRGQFKLISQAYEVLSDPKKRDLYDQGGEQAIKEGGVGGGGFSSPMDIFDMFFGGGGRMQREKRGKDVVHQLAVSLEDLYNGATRKLALKKNVICDKCDGEYTILFCEVIKVGSLKCVRNEGMPIYRDPFEKGLLIIQFSVKFPPYGWIPPQDLAILEDLLPPRQELMITDDMEPVELTECVSEEQHRGYSGEVYEEDQRPRGGVQCQTS